MYASKLHLGAQAARRAASAAVASSGSGSASTAAFALAARTRALHTSHAVRALTKFAMPAMSPTMTEGGIAAWKKKPGESFSAGEVLLEIETDKATMDVEAQDDGVLAKIIVGDGSKNVKVNSIIAITAEEGDDLSGADALAAEAESSGADSAPKAEEKKPAEESKPAAPEPSSSSSSSSSSSASASPSSDKPADRIFASPIARKIAQEKGIPLAQVKGTGPNGRITKADVEGYKPSAAAQPQKDAQPSAGGARASTPPPPPASSAGAAADYTDIPVSSMRRVIAQRLTESKQNLPHYYVSIDVEMDRVLQLREVFNQAALEKAGANADKAKKAKLSVGDFITKAAAVALREVPDVNSAWYGEIIRQHHKADIAIAVATPTGLITPIVKDVGGKGLTAISAQTKELATRARDGKLKPDEYQGGSFTISNMGMFGITHFTAIINAPHSAILAIGGTEPRIVPDETSEKGWKKVNVMQATISADHRTIDGATAAKWMKAFKDALENPLSFML